MYVSKFYAKRKPEKKLLSVRRETMTLVWSRVAVAPNVQSVAGQSAGGGQAGLRPTQIFCSPDQTPNLLLLD